VKEGGSRAHLVCLGNSPDVSFVNLNGGASPTDATFDLTEHQCELPRLPEIQLSAPGD
jgi:hypothetical protein